MGTRRLLIACLFLLPTAIVAPTIGRNGSVRAATAIPLEKGLLAAFPQDGPKVVWKRDVGEGFSGPVIAGDRLILFHRVGDEEVVECLNAATGKELWKFAYPTSYSDMLGKGDGPRSTPLITGDKVVTLGAEGTLHCLALETRQENLVALADEGIQDAARLLRRRHLADRRAKSRARQRRRQERRHRRLRSRQRQGGVAGHRRSAQLFLARCRHRR